MFGFGISVDPESAEALWSPSLPWAPHLMQGSSVVEQYHFLGVAQLVERRIHSPEVIGSNPIPQSNEIRSEVRSLSLQPIFNHGRIL